LKEKALRRLNATKTRRHGSEKFASQHPGRAVSDREKVLMKAMHKRGLSFRALEEVFYLIPSSGNDARRCCLAATAISRRKARESRVEERSGPCPLEAEAVA
jgi:hypothetical protein